MTEYTGKDTLEFLKDAVNYNRFLEKELLRFLAPYSQAIDFGAGNGEFAARLAKHGKHVTAIEADEGLRKILAMREIRAYTDIAEAGLHHRIYSLNVLEHIEDDETMLRTLRNTLSDAGSLFIYVPAFKCLYTNLDRSLGHFRRYHKKELVQKLQHSGYAIERAEYVDVLGFFCWLLMGKLPGNKTQMNPLFIKLFDRLVFPLSRLLDRLTHAWLGKNLLVIARKN